MNGTNDRNMGAVIAIAIGVLSILGLVVLAWINNAYGDTLRYQGNVILTHLGNAVIVLIWATATGLVLAVAGSAAFLLRKALEPYVEIVAGPAGTEVLVTFSVFGTRMIYDPIVTLIKEAIAANPEPAMLAELARIVQPNAQSRINRIENNYPQLPVSPNGWMEDIQGPSLEERIGQVDGPVYLIGPSGTGKTMQMHAILNERLSRTGGQAHIIDPDDDGGKWRDLPGQVHVYGGDAQEAYNAMMNLGKLARERKPGQPHEHLYFVVDETLDLRYMADGMGIKADQIKTDIINPIVVRGRKRNVTAIMATQSDRVKATMLDGLGDLLATFIVAKLKKDGKGKFWAEIEWPDGSNETARVVNHPQWGDSPSIINGHVITNEEVDFTQPPEVEPNHIEQRALDYYDEGMKSWKIGERIFGTKGGWQTQQAEEILKKFGKTPH